MKKIFITVALMAIASATAMAGGLLTNTNQNAAYVRQMSQNGIIDITGLYANPAGTAFLTNGWHLSLDIQTAKQQRNIETTFPLFALNQSDNSTTHRFEGKAFAPVIPSFQLSYNKDKWSVNANFALVGGGGKCEFDKGLGSFEAAYSGLMNNLVPTVLPEMVSANLQQAPYNLPAATAGLLGGMATYDGYSLNSYMKGRSYYFGLQLGATYKFMDNLAGYVGLRGTYATCNYNGWVHPTAYFSIPAIPGAFPGVSNQEAVLNNYGIDLNCDQTSFGVAPIIGLDYKINDQWNIAAKYEAPTVMKLKNSSEIDAADMVKANAGALIGKFADGSKVREDIPGILALGVQYSPVSCVRINAGFNEYFDKSAKKTALDANGQLADIKGAGIDKNTWEINAGVEYDICKYVTISASYQNTNYGIADDGMSDLSFNLSNQMVGAGLRINATDRCSIDLGYMHTFYGDRTVTNNKYMQIPNTNNYLPKSDNYVRKNDVFGIGVNLAF